MRCRQLAPEPVAQISGTALAAPLICLLYGKRTLFEYNREGAKADPRDSNEIRAGATIFCCIKYENIVFSDMLTRWRKTSPIINSPQYSMLM